MNAILIPVITVTDLSSQSDPAETAWKKSFIQASEQPGNAVHTTSAEDATILDMMKDALKYAEEEDGRVPTPHIDYIYNMLVKHIRATQSGTNEGDLRRKRHKNNKKGHKAKPRRYIYARTQDLFAKNPGLLAKHVRESISYIDQNTSQLPEKDIEILYRGLWETIPAIKQPFSGEKGEADSSLDLSSLLPSITRKDLKARIPQAKTNTAAGPNGLTKKHVKDARIQEILRLFYVFITACGRQPTAWRENRTLLPKQGKDSIMM
jgi:hypothetical protein